MILEKHFFLAILGDADLSPTLQFYSFKTLSFSETLLFPCWSVSLLLILYFLISCGSDVNFLSCQIPQC